MRIRHFICVLRCHGSPLGTRKSAHICFSSFKSRIFSIISLKMDLHTKLSAKRDASKMPRVDRRVQRTRSAILDAFTRLVFKNGFESISPSKLAETANIGRSTFYEHFSGMDELLALSIGHMFDRLAELSLQAELEPELISVIEHFWDGRKLAGSILTGRTGEAMNRHLVKSFERALVMMCQQSKTSLSLMSHELIAVHLAAAQIAVLKAWLSGRSGGSAAEIADMLRIGALGAANALTPPQ